MRGFAGGEEIETAGDSFLIVFSKPSDAVHFGLLLHARIGMLRALIVTSSACSIPRAKSTIGESGSWRGIGNQ